MVTTKGVVLELNSEGIRDISYSPVFMQGMLDRVATSYHKYGPADKADTNWIASLEKRIEKYKEDGNTEWLMDVANWAMLEFMYPRHPAAHYKSTSSDESPGRVSGSGEVVHHRTGGGHTFHNHEGD